MKTKEEILNKHLNDCYFTHHVKLNHKYNLTNNNYTNYQIYY